MASVLFLFLAHLAVGIAASLLLVGQAAGVKFFRFNAGLAAVLLLIALAFRPDPPAGAPAAGLGFGALLIATGALLVYWATIGRALARLPEIDAAFRDGVLSYSKVRAITRVATRESEAVLLEIAGSSSAAQLLARGKPLALPG